jgi:hypothetical protein
VAATQRHTQRSRECLLYLSLHQPFAMTTHLTTAEQAVQRYTSVLPADPSAASCGDGASVPVANVLRLPQHSQGGLST